MLAFLLITKGLEPVQDTTRTAMPLVALQAELLSQSDLNHVQVLPLATITQLPGLLRRYVSINALTQSTARTPRVNTFDILRSCTITPPMNETLAYFITDVFISINELATACARVPLESLQRAAPEVSPYFSSSASQTRQLSTSEESARSKLSVLMAIDERGTMDVIHFFKADRLL